MQMTVTHFHMQMTFENTVSEGKIEHFLFLSKPLKLHLLITLSLIQNSILLHLCFLSRLLHIFCMRERVKEDYLLAI